MDSQKYINWEYLSPKYRFLKNYRLFYQYKNVKKVKFNLIIRLFHFVNCFNDLILKQCSLSTIGTSEKFCTRATKTDATALVVWWLFFNASPRNYYYDNSDDAGTPTQLLYVGFIATYTCMFVCMLWMLIVIMIELRF